MKESTNEIINQNLNPRNKAKKCGSLAEEHLNEHHDAEEFVIHLKDVEANRKICSESTQKEYEQMYHNKHSFNEQAVCGYGKVD